MRKSVCIFLVLFLTIYSIPAFAYNYPNDFWAINSKYEAVLNSNNYADIIKYGSQIINMMNKAPDGKEKTDIYVTRYKEIAKAYAALGDYNNSAYTYNLLYNYASQYSEHWEYAKGAKAYALQYTPSIAMYTDNGSSPYFGAKYEKHNGVLFGMCANGGTGFCYRKVTDGISVDSVLPVSCYAHKYNTEIKTVTYFIDGNYVGMSNEIPYTTYIDASGYQGRHSLKAVAAFSDGQTLVTESAININGNSGNISVKISGERVAFDRDPVLYNDRTMVPMRKIFENLGARVEWDGASQTVTGTKGDRKVRVTVGSKLMYVNSKEITLDTSPIVMSDRTLMPVRAVAEGLGCDVDWIERTSTVEIEPKIFRWSEWTDELPSYVDEDLYYIEDKTEYRYMEKYEEEIDYPTAHPEHIMNYSRTEKTYGNWSNWQRDYISESKTVEVETRRQSEPIRYHFAHYCTGNISDSSDRYMTWDRWWREENSYHDIGWYDYKIDEAPDGKGGYVLYNSDGSIKRCSNTCYRYYIIETTGGDYTEYRYRNVKYHYFFWQYTDWSDWSERYPRGTARIDERTLYRYKEK